MAMDAIRDAIMSGDRSEQTYAGIALPESYRAATVHKDEVEMFKGLQSRDKDPRKSLHIDEVEIPAALSRRQPAPQWLARADWRDWDHRSRLAG